VVDTYFKCGSKIVISLTEYKEMQAII